MSTLRQAAAAWLDERKPAPSELQIERLTCEVRDAERTELVSVRVEQGRLQAVCSCGRPECVHVLTALQLLASEPGTHAAQDGTGKHARIEPPELRSSYEPSANVRLGDALADVVTAVVRAGVCTDRVASVLENLSRVERALPPPLPLGLLRWLGRMHEAIDAQDTALSAQALAAAAAVSSDLRNAESSDDAQRRLCSWFGATERTLQRLSDRSLVEIAREWLHGSTRNQIERRYLIDLETGECFREECVRNERAGSVGPCPRLIGVSLAEIEPSVAPRRLRLLQYTTTPGLERTHWDSVAHWGQRDSEQLSAAYRSAVTELGALAEPFALAAPRAFQSDVRPRLLFERGAPLPLFADDDPGVLKHCERALRSARLLWVAGRLLEHDGQLMLRPLSLALQDDSGMRYDRL
jgi:hypothetical protein